MSQQERCFKRIVRSDDAWTVIGSIDSGPEGGPTLLFRTALSPDDNDGAVWSPCSGRSAISQHKGPEAGNIPLWSSESVASRSMLPEDHCHVLLR